MATNNRWLVLLILLTAPLLSVIDIFIINVAIPAIKTGVHASDGELQLVIAGYLLGYASFLITGARAGDVFGRKKVFMLGMLFFTVISAACGWAQTPLQLNIARFFQGIAAAFMVPQTISYIQVLFPEKEERTKAVGLFGIVTGLAAIIGQFLGGYFSELQVSFGGWRFIFFINLPLGFLALYTAKRYLKETPIKESSFDMPGVAILTTALILLIYPLVQGRESGWPWWSKLSIALSFILFSYFVTHQKKKLKNGGNPLIHASLFSYKDFNLALLAVLFFFMEHTSYLLISTVYLQEGLGIHPASAGKVFVFLGVGYTLSSILSVRWVINYGKVVLQWGIFILSGALLFQYLMFSGAVQWWMIAITFTVQGIGAGMVLPSLLNMALRNIPVHHAGAASGVYSTFQQTASALGICIIGGIFFFFTGGHSEPAQMHKAFQYGIITEIVCLFIVWLVLYLLPEASKSKAQEFAVLAE
jgi:EmrB/QacA subfamily drug resistance transporter